MKHHLNHSLGVWTSVHYNTHASPVTALHWLYLSQRGGRHSQWACVSLSRWVLIYSYSTHTLRWWEYQARIYKTISRLNKTAKNAKNGKNVKERTLNSCNRILLHYPHGFHYPHAVHINGFHYPHGSLMRIFLHCLFAYLWITFPNISNISSFEQRSGPLDPITKTVESYHQDLLRLGHCQA